MKDLASRLPLQLAGKAEIDNRVNAAMQPTIYEFQMGGTSEGKCRGLGRKASEALEALGPRGFKHPVADAQYGDGSRQLGDTYVQALHWPGSHAAVRRWASAYSAWQTCGFTLDSHVLRSDTFELDDFNVHLAIARGTAGSLVHMHAVHDSVTLDLRCFYTTDAAQCTRALKTLINLM